MWVEDSETGSFLEVNAAAATLYGYSRKDFLRMRLSDNRPLELSAYTERRHRDPSTADANNVECWQHRRRDGQTLELQLVSHETVFGGRKARHIIALDVTDRKVLEDQLRQARKMEAVGMLAGGIAHDFNNLLTIISGYSQILLNSIPAGDPNHISVEHIMKAGERAAALTSQLLTFSRRQAIQLRVLDLNTLVYTMGAMLQRLISEDVELRLVLGSELGRVNADPGQIEQVIMNLVVNSRDAMPHGGVLTIETANAELGKDQAGLHIPVGVGSYVALRVSDTGLGMDAETRTHVFEPFFTTKGTGRGTGLGLSTVVGIVKQSGGSLEVRSEPGQGTQVTVYLPRIEQPEAAESQNLSRRASRGSETILLVEDEDMVRALVRQTLEREGYRILDAPDPATAQRLCERYPAPLHLLITDVVLPKQSGRKLAESLLERRPRMRVLYMSGHTDQVLTHGLGEPGRPFLQKPFTPAALADKVREVLDENGKRTCQASG
jgi:PAS domain S-box-containing protein